MRPPLVYLATPYSDPDPAVREARFRRVNVEAARLIRSGLHVYSPISHTHPIAVAGGLDLGGDGWQAFDARMLEICDQLVIFKQSGWEASRGVRAERAMALFLEIPVQFTDPTE